MKRLLALLLLGTIAYFGYNYLKKPQISVVTSSSVMPSQGNLIVSQASDKLGNLAAVLGASISNSVENGKTMLKDATNGASEPIINQLVTKTQDTLKDLPQKEAEKIKYEFCKGVVSEYENKSKPSNN